MRKLSFLITLIILLFSSCKRTETLAPNKDFEKLFQRFHGKYKIISSVAKEELDLNLDGIASTDLTQELPDLETTYLELRILKGKKEHSFNEFWQEVYFSGTGGLEPLSYDPRIGVTFAKQGVVRQFEFDIDLKTIILAPDSPTIDSQRYTRPSSVLIKQGDLIEITKTKRFYSPAGWKNVEVVTLYKRFTMDT